MTYWPFKPLDMPESSTSFRAPLLAVATPTALVLLWATVASLHLFPTSLFPNPLDVARGLGSEVSCGRLINDVVASLFRVLTKQIARS